VADDVRKLAERVIGDRYRCTNDDERLLARAYLRLLEERDELARWRAAAEAALDEMHGCGARFAAAYVLVEEVRASITSRLSAVPSQAMPPRQTNDTEET
jgi:hypothetical protein